MRLSLFLFFVLMSHALFSQDVLMFEETDDLYEESQFGANRKHFLHSFLGMGFYLPGEDDDGVKYWNTNEFHVGLRYKYKLSKQLSTGFDLQYRKSNYRFNQETQIIQDNQFFDKERMMIHSIGPVYYFRFNFDPGRGNFIGNYIDLGVYSCWNFNSAYKTYDSSGGSLFKEQENIYKNLKRLHDFSYGVRIRMAKNAYVLFIDYRLNRLFDEKYNYLELPVAQIGFELGLHN
jgi:hypothetical protein